MSLTLLTDVRAALLALAEATFAPPVLVSDGPLIEADIPARFVLVGTDGGPQGLGDAGQFSSGDAEQVESTIGNGWREETGQVPVLLGAWSARVDLPARRNEAQAMAEQFVAALNADPDLGGLITPGWRTVVTDIGTRDAKSKTGAFAALVLTVTYRSLVAPI